MLEKFLKNNGNSIVFTGHYLEIYIPEKFFETKLAQIEGSTVRTFGLLYCAVFDQKDKPIVKDIINLPTTIYLNLKDIESRKLNLHENDTDGSYKVVKFYKDDNIMPAGLQPNSTNAEMFVDMLIGGKLDYVPYDRLLEVWMTNLRLNKMKLGVSSAVLELILGELYRDKSDPSYKFSRAVNANPKISQYKYRAAGVRELCSRNSTFAALTFEDMDSMITSSLNMNKYNKKQSESPIEKVIKM